MKKIGISIIMLISIIIIGSGSVKAALQANPNTHMKKTDTLTNWVPNIRKMEAADGAMGLSETIKSDLTSNTSNGIDVHQMRTTEYGAMAILAASGYGNPSNDKVIASTTGNNTGVMLATSDYEWTAGVESSGTLSGVNSRYYDSYTEDINSAKPGDALGSKTTTNPGCIGWRGSSSRWGNSSSAFLRGGSNGMFSFYYSESGTNFVSPKSVSHYGRAVVVCGDGL